jgi:Protein-tyrosine phosphatase
MKLYAGSNRHDYTGYSLIINLTGGVSMYYEEPVGEFGAAALCPTFLKHTKYTPAPEPPQLIIPWRDGGVPNFTKARWMDLLADLGQLKGRVFIHCMGGHGRTGTALAIMLSLSGALKKDPVQWLRKNYCEKAVETKSQIDYIESMGIKTSCTPSHMPVMLAHDYKWTPHTWTQEQYNLTKPSGMTEHVQSPELEPLYQCILCKRKRTSFNFYQTFLDMTGFCWTCHQLTDKTNPDIQM